MPQAINELDVDFEAQIQEIKRLISSSNDADRRTALEEQLRELELQRIQDEQEQQEQLEPSFAVNRRKSFRPASAKPRMTPLTSLAEDSEVVPASFQGLDPHHLDDAGLALVSEVFSSSYDENNGPANVLENGSRTLWVSSGMFPQFLRIVLCEPKRVAAVEITCRHVTKLQLRASPSRNVAINRMSIVGELEVSAADSGKLDTHRFALARRASRNDDEEKGGDEKENNEPAVEAIQIDIESGYGDFVCVYFVRLRIASSGQIAS
ncbi:Galactose-binding domain-like [Phytophthora cinnamomi]|uniref:Galactose-binding domain-like n=1 Tax=Phytophthora cinnamomi TaxID=4785 RepID=UPI002A29026F|nr:Galactose-binding domain-like [Phytophthora cinnamomi]KAJ8569255.1 hypothetical protein ON010_g6006 [Phytophthora cinnamomi]